MTNPFIYRQINLLELNPSPGLIINDPLNPQNNVARSTHMFYILKMVFSYAHLSVFQPCSCDMKNILAEVQDPLSNKGKLTLEEYYKNKLKVDSKPEDLSMLKRIFNSHKNPIFTIHKSQGT